MSNINETQRKYLRARLETIVAAKIIEIQRAHIVPNPWPRLGQTKKDYLNTLFRQAGLDLLIPDVSYNNVASGIDTPMDVEHRRAVAEAKTAQDNRIAELKAASGTAMDEIILGSEAEELRSVVDSLNNFAVTNGESN